MPKKVLITGGSGFIGTNLIEHLIKKGYKVLNIDFNQPKISKHNQFWENIDIVDIGKFEEKVLSFSPDYIIHLAARTDLDGNTLDDYSANTTGTENILKIVKKLPELKKIIITSSKFVNPNGYVPNSQFDYNPHTVYGESKVVTENKVWENKPHCDWCIIRPTSIWGPWFGIPYRNFFDMVMKRMYFHIGNTQCYKTYGYIGNSIYQIEALLYAETLDEKNKVFYIGDNPAYEINEWADEIAKELGFNIPTMPKFIIRFLAWFGDFLKVFKIKFPMTSFRYENMTSNGVNDMSNTHRIAPHPPFNRVEGIKNTIQWFKKYEGEI
ncbi:NAD-dependent epimerase/dehydratase family protein [Priestia aryabhattai]